MKVKDKLPIGEKIKYFRKRQGMTQAVLASKLGISPVNISQIETGQRSPTIDTVKAIADALEISLGDLLNERDQKIFYAGADEGEDATEWAHRVVSGYSFSKPEHFLISAFSTLNDEGQQKAVERVEELTEIPKYQRTEDK